jgi:hypothetical protein
MKNFLPSRAIPLVKEAWTGIVETEKSLANDSGLIVIDSFGRTGPQNDSERITYGHFIGERFSPVGPTLKRGSTGRVFGVYSVFSDRHDREG